jgi:phosphopantetheine--protein transferase-like protein
LRGALVGIGIDSVDIERFAAVLARRSAVASRVFTEGERAYAGRLANPTPALAGRFAAKEAVMKALGVGLGSIDWSDVEIIRSDSGEPVLLVGGRAAALASGKGIGSWLVSITHTATVASAVVAAIT